MKVKVVKPVRFLHKGKFYTMNQEFDYGGKMNDYIALVSKSEPAKTPSTPTKAPIKAKVVVENEVKAEIFDDTDFGSMSPEMIKAKIEEIESAPIEKVVEEPQIQEEIEKAKFSISKISRGWYNVEDAEGNELSPKKLRKDDAEALLATLK